MKLNLSSAKKSIIICCLMLQAFTVNPIFGQSAKTITLKNSGAKAVADYTLEIPVEKLKLSLGEYYAVVNEEKVPVEIVTDIYGKQQAVIPVGKIEPNAQLSIAIKQGSAESYPKRTYAELAHKIGGQFEGHKYTGGYSWVKPNYIELPGNFRDHSYYIKYEGPGWESDKVAFRFYLDNRNAIDVFGKKTSDIVLPAVGVDGFDNYHKMADWGMDNMKVGKALGIGTIAIWDGTNAIRVEKKDKIICSIPADGKVRSQVKTIYKGWDANGVKCDLTSLISIDAGSRASHMELFVDKNIDNLATGINKIKDIELIVSHEKSNKWSYIASFGLQSLNKDMQGLAIFVRTKQVKEITSDDLNHVVVLKPENGYVEYYFMPTWELDKEPVKTKEDFMKCIDEVLNRLNNNINVTIK